jgi:hypothetical protein
MFSIFALRGTLLEPEKSVSTSHGIVGWRRARVSLIPRSRITCFGSGAIDTFATMRGIEI